MPSNSSDATLGELLEKLERLCYVKSVKNFDPRYFLDCFESLYKILRTQTLLDDQQSKNKSSEIYTRISSAWVHFFLKLTDQIDLQTLIRCLALKNEVIATFKLGGYKDTLSLLRISKSTNISGNTNQTLVNKYLIFADINSLPSEYLELLKRFPDDVKGRISCALLGQRFKYSERADKNIAIIVNEVLSDISGWKLHNLDLTLVHHAWMYLSYTGLEADANGLRYRLNMLLKDFLKDFVLDNDSMRSKQKRGKKSTIVIPLERFTHKHAMFRCFSDYINGLREEHRVIAIVGKSQIDSVSKDVFDDVFEIDSPSANFRKVIDTISFIKPDIIYFPSVGMQLWSLLLANLRLAPLQIAGQGHPGAICSPQTIDFAIAPQGRFEGLGLEYVEALRHFGPTAYFAKPDITVKSISPSSRSGVAINSKVMKLNHSFLSAVREIVAKQYNQDCIIRFFPGERGLLYDFVKTVLDSLFENTEVYKYMNYNEMMALLSEASVSLSPFPFGNTNGIIDCSLLNVPVIHFSAGEKNVFGDKVATESLGVSVTTITTVTEYISSAVQLLNDDLTYIQRCGEIDEAVKTTRAFKLEPSQLESFCGLFREQVTV